MESPTDQSSSDSSDPGKNLNSTRTFTLLHFISKDIATIYVRTSWLSLNASSNTCEFVTISYCGMHLNTDSLHQNDPASTNAAVCGSTLIFSVNVAVLIYNSPTCIVLQCVNSINRIISRESFSLHADHTKAVDMYSSYTPVNHCDYFNWTG